MHVPVGQSGAGVAVGVVMISCPRVRTSYVFDLEESKNTVKSDAPNPATRKIAFRCFNKLMLGVYLTTFCLGALSFFIFVLLAIFYNFQLSLHYNACNSPVSSMLNQIT